MSDDGSPAPAPTREELLARYAELKDRADALQQRAAAMNRPNPATVVFRFFLLFGLPILAAIGVYLALGSILLAILASIGVFITVLTLALRSQPASMKPGSRSWEADMTAKLLVDVIAARRAALAKLSPDARGRAERELAFLENQLAEQRTIAASNDAGPGKGYVGFTPYNGD